MKGRHNVDGELPENLGKLFREFEPAGDDEENAHNLEISEDMSREDVLNKVLEVIAKI